MDTQSRFERIFKILFLAGYGYIGTVILTNGCLSKLIGNLPWFVKAFLWAITHGREDCYGGETAGEMLERKSLEKDFPELADLIDFVRRNSRELADYSQEQPKLSGRSPGLLTCSGTPDRKGLKDIAETLSSSLDRSASDSIVPDGMDKPEQKRKLLLRFDLARFWF